MSNHAFAAAPIQPPVKTVAPTFNRTPEVKPSTNFETAAKKPNVLESNIGNTRIRDNGSNLAPTTVSQFFFKLWAIHEFTILKVRKYQKHFFLASILLINQQNVLFNSALFEGLKCFKSNWKVFY